MRDIVAGSILGEVHGLVSHAQDFPGGAGVAGECGYAEAGSHLDVQILLAEEDLRSKQVLDAARHARAHSLEVWGRSTTNSSPP